MKNYEESTAFLGQWGCFQQVNFFLLCALAVQNGLTVFVVVFMAATPRHHCRIPDGNLTREWISVAIPTEVCLRYELRKWFKLHQVILICVVLFCVSQWMDKRSWANVADSDWMWSKICLIKACFQTVMSMLQNWSRRAVWTGGATAKTSTNPP